jgi:hypothetical protein
MVGFTIGTKGEAARKIKPVIREQQYDDDDNNNNNNSVS